MPDHRLLDRGYRQPIHVQEDQRRGLASRHGPPSPARRLDPRSPFLHAQFAPLARLQRPIGRGPEGPPLYPPQGGRRQWLSGARNRLDERGGSSRKAPERTLERSLQRRKQKANRVRRKPSSFLFRLYPCTQVQLTSSCTQYRLCHHDLPTTYRRYVQLLLRPDLLQVCWA